MQWIALSTIGTTAPEIKLPINNYILSVEQSNLLIACGFSRIIIELPTAQCKDSCR